MFCFIEYQAIEMVNKENPLKSSRKGCGVLEFQYGKSHHKTYEAKFILIIARTFSGKSFLTVNLLCTMDLKNKYKQISIFCPEASNKNECYTGELNVVYGYSKYIDIYNIYVLWVLE